MGQTYRNNDLVVCLEDGRPWNLDKFSGEFSDFLARAADFPTFGSTTFAMLMPPSYGVDPKTVSERLGHTSIKVTPRMRDRSAQTMEGIMSRIRSQQKNRTGATAGQESAAK